MGNGEWGISSLSSLSSLSPSPELYRKEGRVDAHPLLLCCDKLQLLDGSSFFGLVLFHGFLILFVAAQDTEIYQQFL